jgi:Flp pilus assembly pilin Flp
MMLPLVPDCRLAGSHKNWGIHMSKTSSWQRLWDDDQGQGLTEYALLIALVSLGLITLLGLYRNAIGNVFRNATTVLNGNSRPIVISS